MKMISSTRQTSTSGVTLISALTSPTPSPACMTDLSLQEEIHELGGGIGHLDLEPLELVLEVVEEHHGDDRHGDAGRCGDQRLGDPDGDSRQPPGTGLSHVTEGGDDAEDGAEQSDECGGRSDRGQG